MGIGCPKLTRLKIFNYFWYFCVLHEKMKKRFLTFTLALFGMTAFTQTMEVGVFGGISYYLGDLNPGIHFLGSKPAYGVLARYVIDSRWVIKVNAYRGKVIGDDRMGNTNDVRGLKFESKVTDISLTAEFNFFDYFTGSRRNTLSPFIFGGFGVFFFKPIADGFDLRSIGTEGQQIGFDGRKPYNKFSFSIPFGVGFKYNLNSRLCLSGEWGLRKTFTDYLDDVSTTYYLEGSQINTSNPEEVLSDPTLLHKPRQERGNPTTNDWYNFTGISLTYKFRLFGNKKCPDQWRSKVD
jgi:hypothetical protein